MRTFFVGLHHPHDAAHFAHACLSIRTLWKRKKPIPGALVLVDSGAFMELLLHGRYEHSVEKYASRLAELHRRGIVRIMGAVAQDYMCEPFMLEKTGLTTAEHQRLTIERYDALCAALAVEFPEGVPFPVLPVLQGYAPAEYVAHVAEYGARLTPGMWVGVGSVCKRNSSPDKIAEVLRAIKGARPDLLLHGFGVKKTALASTEVRDYLETSDSAAWSYSARKQGRSPHDVGEAQAFVAHIAATMASPRVAYQLPLW